MSATNHTANYELSQYIGSDEPKYLTDYNGDMSKIDTAIKTVETSATTANTGVATNASAISALDTAVGSLQTQVTTVAGVANGNTGSINTINSLIGSGEPTTSDKTIIGAINEIYADITGGGTDIDADNVDYDNTTSGLTATDVQAALDEINAKIPSGGAVEADDVVYDNTSSGLSATNVQDAVDEVNGKFGGMEIQYDSVGGKPQYSTDGGTTWVNFNGAFSVDEVESADERAGGASVALAAHTMTYTLLADHEELLIIANCSFDTEDTSATAHGESVTITLTNSGTATPTEYHATSSQPFITHKGVYVLARHTWHLENAKAGDVLTFTYTPASTSSTAAYFNTINDYTIFSIN